MTEDFSQIMKEMKDLRQQNCILQKKISSLEKDLLKVMKKKEFNKDDILEYFNCQDHISNLEAKLVKSKQEVNELRHSISTNSSHVSSFSDESTFNSLLEVNSDISHKNTEINKQLSSALFENAELKRTISFVEAENARLTTENHELRWKFESSSKDSDLQRATTDSSIDELKSQLTAKKTQLDSANSAIDDLKYELKMAKMEANKFSNMVNENSVFKQEMVEFHQKISKHKEELRKAKMEIERLTLKNNSSDEHITMIEKTLRRHQKENIKLMQKNQSLMMEYESFRNLTKSQKSSPNGNSNNNNSGGYNNNSSFSSFNDNNNTNTNNIKNTNNNNNDIQSKREKQLWNDFQEIKSFCTSLKDENNSLKNENCHLREKCKNYCIRKKQHFDDNRDIRNSNGNDQKNAQFHYYYYGTESSNRNEEFLPNQNLSPCSIPKRQLGIYNPETIKLVVNRFAKNFLLKIEFFETKILASVDHLNLDIQRFQTSWKQTSYVNKSRNNFLIYKKDESSDQFLRNLNREIRIIETLSQSYARTHNIPQQIIPNPSELIGNPKILRDFIKRNEKHHHSHHDRHYS